MTLHLDELKTAIVRDRRVGAVVFDVRPRPKSPGQILRRPRATCEMAPIFDKYVTCFGLFGLGVNWTEILRPQAEDLLCRVLTSHITSHEELMARRSAETYANCFLNQFSPTCQMVTNGPFKHMVLDSGRSATNGPAIDTGVVCADRDNIGLLWIGDHD